MDDSILEQAVAFGVMLADNDSFGQGATCRFDARDLVFDYSL